MSSEFYSIAEHILEGSHIRAYPRSTSKTEDVLHLAIKQYTPLRNPNPSPGDITIIAAHANGFPKELYEPLWDELLKKCNKNGFGIRGIWIADTVHQGWSGALNEDKLGNDPSWLDHSRDLLHMVNTFRSQMPRPIIGLGHSMGGCQMANLALLHPRLFETIILVDPVIMPKGVSVNNAFLAFSSAKRRDRWPSREAAAAAMSKSKHYQRWDKRVFERWIRFGLRELPTSLYSLNDVKPAAVPAIVSGEPTATPTPSGAKEVTLTTTKHQEVMTFIRLSPLDTPAQDNLVTSTGNQTAFSIPEIQYVFQLLPHVRPSVLYVFASESDLTLDPKMIEDKMTQTGSGARGSGGVKKGRVANVIIQKAGHLIPMERVEESARVVAEWVGKEMVRWRDGERRALEEWDGKTGIEKSVLSERYLDELRRVAELSGFGKKGGFKL